MAKSITINLTVATLVEAAKKNLSSYGKRRKDAKGNTLFANITTSTAEDDQLEAFVLEGIDLLLGEMSSVLIGVQDSTSVCITFNSERISEQKSAIFTQVFCSFIADYVLSRALAYSGLMQDVQDVETDMKRHLDAAIKLIYMMDAPTSSSSYSWEDVTGSVELDDSDTDDKSDEKDDTSDTDDNVTDKGE